MQEKMFHAYLSIFNTYDLEILADLVNFGSQTRNSFYQHEKLKLNAVRMCTISYEDIEKRHAVAREP